MYKSAMSRAEEQFAATQKKAEKVLPEKERAALERAQRTAHLKALRLAKEAADREAVEAKSADGPR